MGLAVFVPAGTVDYAPGWILLAVFVGCSLAITLDLARRDPALLARRVHAGPKAETRTWQKVVQALAGLAFIAILVVGGLDRRFGWSSVPAAIIALGDALVAAGFAIVYYVFRANSHAAASIAVDADQRVIDTGPYAVVRHPMYAGALVLLAGMPLALGSWWGLVTLPLFVAILVARLIDEEVVLVRELVGYVAYRARVRRRLIPYIW
jgi:protein-S-isoprenylcysteine O-methyltransferase Ste14